jgi:hypothetical protein
MPPPLPGARWALTPPFHRRRAGAAVSSLWRFPSDRSARALPGTVASGSPDFPRTVRPAAIQPSARPAPMPCPTSRQARANAAAMAQSVAVERTRGARTEPQPHRVEKQIICHIGIAEGQRVRAKPGHVRRIGAVQTPIGPDSEALACQPPPVEAGSGVALSLRRHVGMPDDASGRDVPPCKNTPQQLLQRVHQRGGEGRGPVIVELDPDGAGIHVTAPAPAAGARMPGAPFLVDKRGHRSVPRNQPVAGHFARRIAERAFSRGGIGHGGVMQHHKLRPQPVAAWPVVGRAAHPSWSVPKGCGGTGGTPRAPLPGSVQATSCRRSRPRRGRGARGRGPVLHWSGTSPARGPWCGNRCTAPRDHQGGAGSGDRPVPPPRAGSRARRPPHWRPEPTCPRAGAGATKSSPVGAVAICAGRVWGRCGCNPLFGLGNRAGRDAGHIDRASRLRRGPR